MSEDAATLAYRAIHDALAEDRKTLDPMNALVVWTELGKGLAGMVERVGGDAGTFRGIVVAWFREHGAAAGVDLAGWAYQVAPEQRLTAFEVAKALRRTEDALERALPALAARVEVEEGEGKRLAFLAVARAWLPVGRDIVGSLPAAKDKGEPERLGAMMAWVERYLPKGPPAADVLGVKGERKR